MSATTERMHPRAAQLIQDLQLCPHPEGGFFREIHRSALRVRPHDDRPDRHALTTIYFLLLDGSHSRWHRVRSDEVWHLCEGGPIELLMTRPEMTAITRLTLGTALTSDGPVRIVPADSWQAARSLGPYALAACTVGPGFEFADFSLLRDDDRARARLTAIDEASAALL